MVIQIQIGLIFDAVSLVLNRDIQFLIAAFEFQIGIVVFDFRFDNLQTLAACLGDDFFRQRRNGNAFAGQLGFIFELPASLMMGFHGSRADWFVYFRRHGRGKRGGGKKGQDAGQQQGFCFMHMLTSF